MPNALLPPPSTRRMSDCSVFAYVPSLCHCNVAAVPLSACDVNMLIFPCCSLLQVQNIVRAGHEYLVSHEFEATAVDERSTDRTHVVVQGL